MSPPIQKSPDSPPVSLPARRFRGRMGDFTSPDKLGSTPHTTCSSLPSYAPSYLLFGADDRVGDTSSFASRCKLQQQVWQAADSKKFDISKVQKQQKRHEESLELLRTTNPTCGKDSVAQTKKQEYCSTSETAINFSSLPLLPNGAHAEAIAAASPLDSKAGIASSNLNAGALGIWPPNLASPVTVSESVSLSESDETVSDTSSSLSASIAKHSLFEAKTWDAPDKNRRPRAASATTSTSSMPCADYDVLSEEDIYDFEVVPKTTKYDLRPPAQHDPRIMEAWFDTDASGNFNPKRSLRGKRRKRRRVRTRLLNESLSTGEQNPKKRKLLNMSYGRWTEKHAPVTFHIGQRALRSPHGQRLVEAIEKSWNWNDWPSHLDELLEPEANFTELSLSFLQPSRLRSRRDDSDIAKPHRIYEQHVAEEPTLGHPAARGCRACWQIGITCNLLDDEATWPCIPCQDENEDCELILEPLEKKGCERCKRRRVACSFRKNAKHAGPCLQCCEKGFKCVAGPKNGRVRTGPSLALEYRSPSHTVEAFRLSEIESCDGLDDVLIDHIVQFSILPILLENSGPAIKPS